LEVCTEDMIEQYPFIACFEVIICGGVGRFLQMVIEAERGDPKDG